MSHWRNDWVFFLWLEEKRVLRWHPSGASDLAQSCCLNTGRHGGVSGSSSQYESWAGTWLWPPPRPRPRTSGLLSSQRLRLPASYSLTRAGDSKHSIWLAALTQSHTLHWTHRMDSESDNMLQVPEEIMQLSGPQLSFSELFTYWCWAVTVGKLVEEEPQLPPAHSTRRCCCLQTIDSNSSAFICSRGCWKKVKLRAANLLLTSFVTDQR